MLRESERVKLMKKNFMKYHNDGKTIGEIAELYNVSTWSVYHSLQEIADENGVTRDSLLERVSKPHEIQNPRKLIKRSAVNPAKLEKDFQELSKKTNNIINELDRILQEER